MRQEDDPFYSFHIDHVASRQHGGADVLENLALACYHCNRHKGPNLSGWDPETRRITRLFNPRHDSWTRHFQVVGAVIAGRTAVGRATVRVLKVNAPPRLDLRTALVEVGCWP
jgi:hypothetical protein